jgi:putative transposase
VSRFRKLSHTIWHCQYHIVWVPKYRYRVLTGAIKESCEASIHAICGFSSCEVVELNVQPDHVHLIVMVPPKLAISTLMGRLKGQSSMRISGSSATQGILGQSFLVQGSTVLTQWAWMRT